jgi:hypothetical protein
MQRTSGYRVVPFSVNRRMVAASAAVGRAKLAAAKAKLNQQ